MNYNTKIISGVRTGMSNAAYHANPAIGSSRLKRLSPPALFPVAADIQSPALRFGSAFHAWIEGNPIHITGIDCPRRSRDDRQRWAEFFSAYGADGQHIITLPAHDWESEFTAQTGRIIASPEQILAVQGMAASIAANPDAMACLTVGESEVSMFWHDPATGIALKCRPDHLNRNFCGELKSAVNASERAFQSSIMKFGYHISAAMYLDGIKICTNLEPTHRFVVVEKSAPYLCAAYQLSDAALAVGHAEYRRLLQLLETCMSRNEWPGLPGNLELELPAWAYSDEIMSDEVNLGDENE